MKTDAAGEGGDWVRFQDYASAEFDPQSGMPLVGGTEGELYFCGLHLAAARGLTTMRTREAVTALKMMFGDEPPCHGNEVSRGPAWKRWIDQLFHSSQSRPQ